MSEPDVTGRAHPDEALAWYANGTLPATERGDVERHLAGCGRCRGEVAFLEGLRREVKATPVRPPGELGLARLMRMVKAEERASRAPSAWWRPALAAAAVLIVVQGAILADLATRPAPGPITPLSAPPPRAVVLQVTFAPEATEARIREALEAVGGTLVGGPGALGVYRVALDLPAGAEREIEAAVTALRARRDVVTHVARE